MPLRFLFSEKNEAEAQEAKQEIKRRLSRKVVLTATHTAGKRGQRRGRLYLAANVLLHLMSHSTRHCWPLKGNEST